MPQEFALLANTCNDSESRWSVGPIMKNLRLEENIPKSKLEMTWRTKKQSSTPVTELRNFSEEIVGAWADLREIIGLVKALGD